MADFTPFRGAWDAYQGLELENDGQLDLADEVRADEHARTPFHRRCSMRKGSDGAAALYDAETAARWVLENGTHPETREPVGPLGQARARWKLESLRSFPKITFADAREPWFPAWCLESQARARAFLGLALLERLGRVWPRLTFGETEFILKGSPEGSALVRRSSLGGERDGVRCFVVGFVAGGGVRQTRLVEVDGAGTLVMRRSEVPRDTSLAGLQDFCQLSGSRAFPCTYDALLFAMGGRWEWVRGITPALPGSPEEPPEGPAPPPPPPAPAA